MIKFLKCWFLHRPWWHIDWHEVGNPPVFFIGHGMTCDKCDRKWVP